MVSLASLQKLSTIGLSTEQMECVISVLAVELEPLEKIRLSAAQRQANKRASRDSNVTSTVTVTTKEISPTPPKENNNLSVIPPYNPPKQNSDFLTFKNLYPKRDGNADWKAADKAFNAALKRADLETILSGARAYAAHCQSKGKIGTEFVKQARSWLNGDCWTEWASKDVSQTAFDQVPVIKDTPEWSAWCSFKGKPLPEQDIRNPATGKLERGWYCPTQFPPTNTQRAA